MMGCDSVDYYIESPIDNNGGFDLLNTSCPDIQIQIIQADLNRNTSVVEEVGKLIDTSHVGKRSSDSSQALPTRQSYLIHVETISRCVK